MPALRSVTAGQASYTLPRVSLMHVSIGARDINRLYSLPDGGSE